MNSQAAEATAEDDFVARMLAAVQKKSLLEQVPA
jgi:hypothetical protein